MTRRTLFASGLLLVSLGAIAACSNDDSAAAAGGDSGAGGDATSGSDGSTASDGSSGNDGSASDGSITPPKKCGGVGTGTFSGVANPGSPVFANGYSLFYDGLLDASLGSFTVACAFSDAGLVTHLPAAVGVDTVQPFPNDHVILTFKPSAMDAASATVSGSVGDD